MNRESLHGGWIQTFTGRRFFPLAPKPEDLDIIDIAHALAYQCRFAGHVTEFYSVAQHSVRVSFIVPPEVALCGLMHDASEAYLVDLPRPIKVLMPQYKEAEERLMTVIAERFGFAWPMPQAVLLADDVLLMDEATNLIRGGVKGWPLKFDPKQEACTPLGGPMTPHMAETLFLARYCSLTGTGEKGLQQRFVDLVETPAGR